MPELNDAVKKDDGKPKAKKTPPLMGTREYVESRQRAHGIKVARFLAGGK